MRDRIVVFFAHADRRWRDKLLLHLRSSSPERPLETCDVEAIPGGLALDGWAERTLSRAGVAVFLLSPNLLASRTLGAGQLDLALGRHVAGGLRLVPLRVRHVAFPRDHWLARVQHLPRHDGAISSGGPGRVDQDFAEAAAEIGALLPATGAVHGTDALAPRGEMAPYFEGPGAVPALPVPHFTGRADETRELAKKLSSKARAICVVATGLGGIGKSALVQNYVATRASGQFRDGSVWMDASALPRELARVSRRFGWSEERDPTVEEAYTWLVRALHDRAVLVVIDNVDPALAAPSSLPIAGGRCRAILTSRTVTLHEDLGKHAVPFRIDVWSRTACRKYLRQVVPDLASADDGELDALADFVGRLPLAVRLIAKLLLRPGTTPTGVLARLETTPLGSLESAAKGSDRGIVATFGAAVAALTPAQRSALVALACSARETRAAAVASVAGLSVGEAEDALVDLAERSLAEHQSGADRPWGLHDVLRLFALQLDGASEHSAIHDTYALTIIDAYRDKADWRALDEGMPEVLAVVDRRIAAGDGVGASQVLSRVRDHLNRRGRYADLLTRYQRLTRMLPSQDPHRVRAFMSLGSWYRALGEVRRAVECFDHALALAKAIGDSEAQSDTMNHLGLCYSKLDEGLANEATRSFERAAEMASRIGDRAGEAIALTNLAARYLARGAPRKAIECLERAQTIDVARKDLRGQAANLRSLGTCHLAARELDLAMRCTEQALAINEQIGDLAGQAGDLGNMGLCHRNAGRLAEASECHRRSLSIFEKLEQAEGVGGQLTNIGLCEAAMGRFAEAADAHRRALAVGRRIGNRTIEAGALANLGACALAAGDLEGGIEHIEAALPITEKLGNVVWLEIQNRQLSVAYGVLGNYQKCAEHGARAVSGPDETASPLRLTDLQNVGAAYMNLGDTKRAIEYLERALRLARTVGPKMAPGIEAMLRDLRRPHHPSSS